MIDLLCLMKESSKNDNQLKIDISLANSPIGKFVKNLPFFSFSEKLKKGFKEEYVLRDGLKIVINEYKLRKNIVVDYSINQAPLEFAYCLSGELSIEINQEGAEQDKLEISKGTSAVFYLPNTNGKMSISGKEYLKILSFHVSPDYLKEFIEPEFDEFPIIFTNLTSSEFPNSFIILNKINSLMLAAANHLLDNLLSGAPKKMFLESKALEMMSLSVAEIMNKDTNDLQISDYLKEQIIALESRIRCNPNDNFPSLRDISNSIGLAHTKLNRIFKSLYGNTVFGYIRDIRLFKSKELIEQNNMTITEISFYLRWSSPAHFARDFKQRFGRTPKQFQKSRKLQ